MTTPRADVAVDEAAADPVKRLSSDERRRQILVAALAVFGARGYEGATTDEVARAAGVSQPYVVRLFGSKENLYLATIDDALSRMLAGFRAALAADDPERPAGKRIGQAYVDLLEVRGLHQTLANAYLMGSHPVIGPAARRGFAAVWRFFRDELGLGADEARVFMAEGMLISTMIGLRLVDDYGSDPQITELFRSCFPTEMPHILDLVPRGTERW
ncbi:TetR/AcrR family transcriptional regulator [Microbacterium allomyrinae]|jgi:AcrR family transcriptional regulator|uniref:TetR/AcrR family transcriptional regulator n=1 Tax=Microbacterium allomyrinae TaxID=2830666 RepID=A0A9X1S4X5_9MICO|nr:TetR/AcrR family transcriptional regulator [Microbacterium allomyrinae]MCC2033912.1 TetR/AcrR family transcriptional regulator [Microbacterium allomyrinae]